MKTKRRSVALPTFNAIHLLDKYPKDEHAIFLAEVFGVSRGTINRWRSNSGEGNLSIFKADHYACRIGIHPANIWQDWYEKQEEYYGK